MIDEKKALELIAQGEGQHVEFKESGPRLQVSGRNHIHFAKLGAYKEP